MRRVSPPGQPITARAAEVSQGVIRGSRGRGQSEAAAGTLGYRGIRRRRSTRRRDVTTATLCHVIIGRHIGGCIIGGALINIAQRSAMATLLITVAMLTGTAPLTTQAACRDVV